MQEQNKASSEMASDQVSNQNDESLLNKVNQQDSLLAQPVYKNHVQKDLEIYKAVCTQLNGPKPKSRVFAISASWLQSFIDYGKSLEAVEGQQISDLSQVKARPGPIINFDLIDLLPEYEAKLQAIQSYDVCQWHKEFNDWKFMTLKTGIQEDEHFRIVSMANWQKLLTAFGGAPEIVFFNYTMEDDQGNVEYFHDDRPFKVSVKFVYSNQNEIVEQRQYLISPYITSKTFMLYISSTTINDGATRSNLFIVNKKKEEQETETDKPLEQIIEIPTKGAGKTYLYEYNVCIDAELYIVQHHTLHTEVNQSLLIKNSIQTIANVAQIPFEEIKHLLPQQPSSSQVISNDFEEQRQQRMMEEQRRKFDQKESQGNQQSEISANAIPAEYANDPDLWQAIQASLGNNMPEESANQQFSIPHIQNDYFGDSNQNNNQQQAPSAAKTPSTADNNDSCKNNVSFHSAQVSSIEDDLDMIGTLNELNNGEKNHQDATAPQVHNSAFVQNDKSDKQQNQNNNANTQKLSYAESQKLKRENLRQQFQAKREQARMIMANNQSMNTSKAACLSKLKSFGEVHESLLKLRANFDAIASNDNNPVMMINDHCTIQQSDVDFQQHQFDDQENLLKKQHQGKSTDMLMKDLTSDCFTEGDDEE